MSTSNTRARHFRSTVGKIVMALVFASVIGGISPLPALGQDHERRHGQQRPEQQRPEQQRPEQQRHGQQRHGQQRQWQLERSQRARAWRDERGRRAYQPYAYAAPIYVPPPVFYAPPPPPGISIFFPPIHIR